MSADPRKFFAINNITGQNCTAARQSAQTEAAHRRGFLDSITKIGDLEILNQTGHGDIAEGLRVLSSVSDRFRQGNSAVPGRETDSAYNTTLGTIVGTSLDAIDSGAQAVLDTVGLGAAVGVAAAFSPDVANRATGAAQQIFQKVKNGEFELSDIPEFFQDFNNLEQLVRGIFPTTDNTRASRPFQLCQASPYAMDLIAHAPKFNFMFIMEVEFSPAYQAWKDIGSVTSFVVKRSTRPAVEFEYEEVNMYNFWTRIPKKTIYPPMTMNFYDDNRNAAHLFYTAYMRAMSPIANKAPVGASSTNQYEKDSMAFGGKAAASTFKSGNPILSGYSSSLGPLIGNTKSIVERIRLYHVFDYGRLMNIYNFYNPRITMFTPSELNMAETGDGAEFEFQFGYDSMFIEPGFSIHADEQGIRERNIQQLSAPNGTGKFPIKPIFLDGTDAHENSQQFLAPTAQVQAGQESNNVNQNLSRQNNQQQTAQQFASGGSGAAAVNNLTTGITGAINDSVTSQKATQSNAFLKQSGFSGSDFIGST